MAKVPSVWTVLSMLEWATAFFEEKNVNSPRMSIEWLLADVLSVKRLDLYLEYDRPLSTAELDTLRPYVKRRAAHEPLQYITGTADFHNISLNVAPGVLIPRQETEQLVDWILQLHPNRPNFTVLDVGTGSGCIPIALKNERPDWDVYAIDISEEALQQAQKNAELNEVEVHFAQDDLFNPTRFTDTTFNLIISNPPYILHSEKPALDDEVKNYEPEVALFCNSTQEMYGAIEKLARSFLKPEGSVYLELHEHFSPEVSALFTTDYWKVETKNDYSDKPRFLKTSKQ